MCFFFSRCGVAKKVEEQQQKKRVAYNVMFGDEKQDI